MNRPGSAPLLEVEELAVRLPVEGELRTVLHDVTFSLQAGQAVGLVGESGSGKSMTARSIARLLPAGAVTSGRINFDGSSVLDLRGQNLRAYRANAVSMIFQDPRAHINPLRKVGDFLTETMRTNDGLSPRLARQRALDLLDAVCVDGAEERLGQYPHAFSGGMLQRVMIAAALASRPRLILADEPTTALDVTTQSEVMAILDERRREEGMAMLFITHDLDLAGAVCDRTVVMYAGSIMEDQESSRLHTDPLHPYTAALVYARPDISRRRARLDAIPGQPLSAYEAPSGCAFAGRCSHVVDACVETPQVLETIDAGRSRCGRAVELRGQLLVPDSQVGA